MSTTFADLGVPTRLCELLARQGITEPFPIQAASLPEALAGRDICGRAPTGSGKTLAFGLTIATRARAGQNGRPTTLVLVPTRELASQVAAELDALRPFHGQTIVTVYGGVGYGSQRQALRKGASIVVACPGRLEDLVERGDVRLGQVELVVVDEADRMADMGFLPAVRRLLDQTASKRQTLLFSATLDREIDVLVRRYQNDPGRHDVMPDEDRTGDVTHGFWRIDRTERVDVTAGIVRRHGRVMVFCRTRHGADRLVQQLARGGVDARAVHGSRSQKQREKALAAFAAGRVAALVATDVAARGIHVDEVACVLHFDPPAEPKDYIHRSGRTARAGASGHVISLVLAEQQRAARALQRALDLPQELTKPDLEAHHLQPGEPVRARTNAKPQSRSRAQSRSKPAEARPASRQKPAAQSSNGAGGGRKPSRSPNQRGRNGGRRRRPVSRTR